MYELRTLKGVYSCRHLNNDEILLNYIVSRKHIEVGDILYAFYTDIRGMIVYAEDINSMDELYNCTMNPDKLQFTFVSPIIYKLLIQEDFKESSIRRTTTQFKDVRQIWDYDNPCLNCNFVFLKSQTAAFRKKCCANGRFTKKELPQNLQFYCRFEDNHIFNKNCHIYNNLLSFGSLGLDKQYDSNYIKTQGGSVTLQGRTYLHHKRSNDTKALVFFTNGHKNDEEEDRIIEDLQRVVVPYNMNGDNTDNFNPHIRIVNAIRSEQYAVNDLVLEYCSILENMQHMTYKQLKIEITNTPKSIYDISCYRSAERGEPCMHVILKDTIKSATVSAGNGYYEAVLITNIF